MKRKNKGITLLLGLFLVLASFPALAGDSLSLDLVYWSPSLNAEGQFTSNGIGTPFDFSKDLGMESKAMPEARLNIITGNNSMLRLSGGALQLSGDNVIQRNIEFNGQTYPINSRVVSELNMESFRLGWIWEFIHNRNRTFQFGTVLELKAYSMDAKLAAPDLQPPINYKSKSFVAGAPTLGLRMDIAPLHTLHIFAEGTGIKVGKYGDLTDAEGGIRYQPLDFLSFTGGYRMWRIRAKDEPDYFNFKLSGPYFAMTFHL